MKNQKNLASFASVVFLFCLASLCLIADGHCEGRAVQEARKRNLHLETSLGSSASAVLWMCTGNMSTALTAAHTIHRGEMDGKVVVAVDGYETRVLKYDSNIDLALLSFNKGCEEPIMPPQMTEAEPLQVIYVVGNPLNMMNIAVTGHTAGTRDDTLSVADITCTAGYSGSGVWREDGKFLGIAKGIVGIENTINGTFMLYVREKAVKKFLKGGK